MKIFFRSLCAGLILSLIFSFFSFEASCREISDKVFRVHILANSDSYEDQQLKLKVRDAVILKSEELLIGVHDKETAKEIIGENIELFAQTASEVIRAEGFDYSVKVSIQNICFDTRYYDNVTMPGGFYDALQIKIGEAAGKNWWCVMYPSLCLFSVAEKSNTLENNLTKNEYGIVTSKGKFRIRFKAVEIFSSILDFFS